MLRKSTPGRGGEWCEADAAGREARKSGLGGPPQGQPQPHAPSLLRMAKLSSFPSNFKSLGTKLAL